MSVKEGPSLDSRETPAKSVLSQQTRDILELGLAALAFGATEHKGLWDSSKPGQAAEASETSNPDGNVAPAKTSVAIQPRIVAPAKISPVIQPRAADFEHSLNESAIAAAPEKSPVPFSPAYVDGSPYAAKPGGNQSLKGAVEEDGGRNLDVDDLAREIASGTPGTGPPKPVQIPQTRQSLGSPNSDIAAQEDAERHAIRLEIQQKMAAMRDKMRAEKASQGAISCPNPAPLRQQESMNSQSARGQNVLSPASAGNAFWKDLLSDLNLEIGQMAEHNRSDRGLSQNIGVNDGSNASSFISSRSPSPSRLLQNTLAAAAKRETLLGSSLSSDFGSARGSSLRSSRSDAEDQNVRGADFNRQPDLGTNWQNDMDQIGMQALSMLDRLPRASAIGSALHAQPSHTQALLRQQLESERSQQGVVPHPPASQSQPAKSGTNAPQNLQVQVKIEERGAAVHATWSPVRSLWSGAGNPEGLSFEVQMIVRWIADQTWMTVSTSRDHACTITGLKPGYPFALRVRAIAEGWASDFTDPLEFVTEPSQVDVIADVSAGQSTATTGLESNVVAGQQPRYQHVPSYLDRVLQERNSKLMREERARDQKHVADQTSLIQSQNERHTIFLTNTTGGKLVTPRVIKTIPDGSFSAVQRDSRADLPHEVHRVQVSSNPSIVHEQDKGQNAVTRITLDNPENPHHDVYQKLERERALRTSSITQQSQAQINGHARVLPYEVETPSSHATYEIRGSNRGTFSNLSPISIIQAATACSSQTSRTQIVAQPQHDANRKAGTPASRAAQEIRRVFAQPMSPNTGAHMPVARAVKIHPSDTGSETSSMSGSMTGRRKLTI